MCHLVIQHLTMQLVYACILSRLDYCNSVLAGLPKTTLARLQSVQNAAARLILNLNRWDHVTAALQQLHWLPVDLRVQYKLCIMMHSVHYRQCPSYLADTVSTVVDQSLRPGLHSAQMEFLESLHSLTLVMQPGINYHNTYIYVTLQHVENTSKHTFFTQFCRWLCNEWLDIFVRYAA